MSEEKVKELQEFVDDFHTKLKEAYNIFEANQNKIKTLKKSHSQIENTNKHKENKFPSISKNKPLGKINLKKNLSNNNLIIRTPIWRPPNGYPNYFEEFKRLQYKHEISDWEKVCNIFILKNYFLIYRKEFLYVKEVMKKKLNCHKNQILFVGNYMDIILINIPI